jgi:hypothetical protein
MVVSCWGAVPKSHLCLMLSFGNVCAEMYQKIPRRNCITGIFIDKSNDKKIVTITYFQRGAL